MRLCCTHHRNGVGRIAGPHARLRPWPPSLASVDLVLTALSLRLTFRRSAMRTARLTSWANQRQVLVERAVMVGASYPADKSRDKRNRRGKVALQGANEETK